MMQGAQTLDKVGTELAKELGKVLFRGGRRSAPKARQAQGQEDEAGAAEGGVEAAKLSIQGNAKELVARLTEAAC